MVLRPLQILLMIAAVGVRVFGTIMIGYTAAGFSTFQGGRAGLPVVAGSRSGLMIFPALTPVPGHTFALHLCFWFIVCLNFGWLWPGITAITI
jgi:hypothetical protein